ncbi:D-alanyl-D-alanine carboxypeptidase [Salinisphaera orenii MK-B5]|uniref:D-alanyl-D-alanine carboxypeptidase n=1 Tax=Salinisphaera orenii MK-B5 TaxID=856730 RepID=A0A423PGM7_9GAMM|nr:D-alanyl-D-alanine carboxypeptidase/D-alanyl-D-alanine-endopeptidase [Salinisphaera orenii]ROO24715.1 D-alanyl-D-alanine carboxypeptidase [Salinisphaera orenii MK-B5]
MSTARSVARRGVVALLAVACLLAPVSAGLAAERLSSLRSLSQQADVSALVVRLDDMQPIARLNPDRRLTPASVSKLYAAAAALEQFGPDHRFSTRFVSEASLTEGVLEGDLVFVGGGDPALDNAGLWSLIGRLQGRGVRRVAGDLVIDDSLFGRVPCLTKDRCDARSGAWHAYSAPLSSAGVNFATVHASVYAGSRADAPTRVVLHPDRLSGYDIDNRVTTGGPDTRAHMKAWRTYDDGRSTLHLRGELPAGGGPYEVHRAVTGPAGETARVLAAMLADAGIEVAGDVRVQEQAGRDAEPLARIDSDTLAEQLIPMMAYSNNYMADTLTLDLAADSQYNRPLTLPLAAQSLEALADRATSRIYPDHAGGRGPIFDSGSGLAVSNELSARDVVALLGYMYRQNALFPAFYGSLPVPLSAPSRTLKQGNFDWLTRLTAKTGTLSEPVTVRSLAGYFRLADGGFGAFAFIINGTADNPALTYRQTVTAYQTDMEAILDTY